MWVTGNDFLCGIRRQREYSFSATAGSNPFCWPLSQEGMRFLITPICPRSCTWPFSCSLTTLFRRDSDCCCDFGAMKPDPGGVNEQQGSKLAADSGADKTTWMHVIKPAFPTRFFKNSYWTHPVWNPLFKEIPKVHLDVQTLLWFAIPGTCFTVTLLPHTSWPLHGQV